MVSAPFFLTCPVCKVYLKGRLTAGRPELALQFHVRRQAAELQKQEGTRLDPPGEGGGGPSVVFSFSRAGVR